MTQVKQFFQNHGDLPGSLLLLFLVFWQVTVGSDSTDQANLERYGHLEEQVFQLCWRSEANLLVIETLMSEAKQFGPNFKAGENGPLFRMPKCERYNPRNTSVDGMTVNIPWPAANKISATVQFWIAVIGIFLFLVGLIARLYLSSPPRTSKDKAR